MGRRHARRRSKGGEVVAATLKCLGAFFPTQSATGCIVLGKRLRHIFGDAASIAALW